ncbi:MAG TPA: energy transducer TonB [Candidatus Ratteibacteria bacterium]|jgi:TonB family protein|nr:energy transducer TonB [bacterium]HRS05728.1 energy transducer TonB [Candidatus Ratteibacteria bacterium]HON04798.1 energy transducer TonB [bacterium]HOQ81925.1 energy transducer TonB [bacterium]HPC29339.1 energy transducer TonB [bacterium]
MNNISICTNQKTSETGFIFSLIFHILILLCLVSVKTRQVPDTDATVYIADIIDISNEFIGGDASSYTDEMDYGEGLISEGISTQGNKTYIPSGQPGINDYAKNLEMSIGTGITKRQDVSASGEVKGRGKDVGETFSGRAYRDTLVSKISDIKGSSQPGYNTKGSSGATGHSSGNFSAKKYEGELLAKIENSGSSVEQPGQSFSGNITSTGNKKLLSGNTLRSVQSNITSVSSSSQNVYVPPYYIDEIKTRIYKNWRRPSSSALKGEKATVSFRINKDGSVSDVIIEKTSGSSDFDSSVVNAVRKSSPFPSLPSGIALDFIDVSAEFSARGVE